MIVVEDWQIVGACDVLNFVVAVGVRGDRDGEIIYRILLEGGVGDGVGG